MLSSHSITYSGRSFSENHAVAIKRLKKIGLIAAALLSLGFTSKAATYTASTSGNYNEETVWQPAYPGNIVSANDTVVVKGNLKLNVDVIVKGTMIVNAQASLTGEKVLVVLEKGIFVNSGITVVNDITNRGGIINRHILETNEDLINTGKIWNNESMVVGSILDNVGTITGNGGNLIANQKLVNSKTGQIVGNVDVCSSNFMNVDGGQLDSANISFCGHRIFNNVFLTASLKKESVVLNLLNSQNKQYKEYTIEKSNDGVSFKTVATIKGDEIKDQTTAFRYTDNELASSNTLYYRMKLVDATGAESVIPAVEVGNIVASKMSAMNNQ